MGDAISEYAILRVERFSLPGKKVDEMRDFIAEPCVVSDDGGAFGLAVRNVANGAVSEELVELNVSHGE